MADTQLMFEGRCLLVVEDEYMVAADIAAFLEVQGAAVVGPAGSVDEALELIEEYGSRLSAAVLDVNLHGERVFPAADALARRGVPYIFTTGYDALALPAEYADVPRCEKPISKLRLAQVLSSRLSTGA